jgi:hypothetical protein
VEFGHDLNAYTSFDETCLHPPFTDNPEKIEKGFTVLKIGRNALTGAEKSKRTWRGSGGIEVGKRCQRKNGKMLSPAFQQLAIFNRLPIRENEYS